MGILNPLDGILNLVSTVVSRIWPDATLAQKQALALQLQQEINKYKLDVGQLKVNEAEASNPNIFVAGWRPFVGWICAAGLAWNCVLQPMLTWMIAVSGAQVPPVLPIDSTLLSGILMGMLGMGTFRTFEKIRGITK